MNIDSKVLGSIVSELFTEAYEGPSNPRMTWFTDNEPGAGLLGTLRSLSAEQASRPLRQGERATAATHTGHLVFALNLANRALRGENVHATANWKDSWRFDSVDEAAWFELLQRLQTELRLLLEAIAQDLPWSDRMNLAGLIGQLAHGAWHLGALRQALGLSTIQ